MATTINANNTDGVVITPDTSGELELQANGVTKAKVTANGLQDANGNSLRGGSFRNLIINGDMQIAQRGTSSSGYSSGDTYLTLDRWRSNVNTAGTWTMSQDTDVPTGQGFASSMKWDCTTANASLSASSYFYATQYLEGQMLQHLKKGTSSAESVTLSFWVKSNKTGTYTVFLYDVDNTRLISKAYTVDVADTWEKKTITYAGDTTGALGNDNGRSLDVRFMLVAGTDWSSGTLQTSWGANVTANRAVGQVNLADSTSNYINITGVQIEVGEGASDFEFLPYDVQLARCQRYYEKSYSTNVVPGTATASGICYFYVARTTSNGYGWYTNRFAVTKRANASVTLYSQSGTLGQVSDADSGTNIGAADVIHNGTGSFLARNISGGSITARAIGWHFVAVSEL